MNHPLLQLFLARLREFYREPEAIFWVYGFPLILAVGLGFAFRDHKPEPAQVDVADAPGAVELCEHLKSAGLVAEVKPVDECRQRLRTGKTALFVEPTDDGFRYVYDEARPEALAARNEVEAALLRWKAGLAVEGHDLPGGGSTTDEPVSEPGSRYIDFLIPGLMGLNVMGGGLFGVGFALVDMRVRKLLKRLLATPMRRSHFMLSILLTRLIMLLPEMALLLLVARLGFGVPLRGNPLLLVLIILVGTFAFAGIGLLLASRTDKTETISGLINLVMLPGWLLSGTFFSAKRFPEAVQPVIQALPLTQLNDALREVMLEGATAPRVAWRLAVLAAWGGAGFLLAMRWFRWQ
ncbi:MAG TPA: ABC transporter permease [Gemmataceae bacterium]|nr:ABC transporter permease [Gemmataceae bacterium]